MPVTRARFTGNYGAPVRRVTIGTADYRQSGTGNAASTAKVIDELAEGVKRLDDEKSLNTLADGDPASFIAYAQTRLKDLASSHPDYSVWKDLIRRAEQKRAENQWASDITSGAKTLEQFRSYLQNQYQIDSSSGPY